MGQLLRSHLAQSAAASAGNQDFTDSGVFGGATPRAAIVYASAMTTDGDTAVSHAKWSFGIYTASGGAFCVSALSENNLSPTDTERSTHDNGQFVIKPDNGGDPPDYEATVSFIANGIRLNVTNASASGERIYVLLLGGSGITDAEIYTSAASLAASGTNAVSTSFAPDMMFALYNQKAADELRAGDSLMSIGFLANESGTLNQGAIGFFCEDGVAPSNSLGANHISQIIYQRTASGTEEGVEITAISSSSFTETGRGAGISALPRAYLCLKFDSNISVQADFRETMTTTGSRNISVSAGKTPVLHMMFGHDYWSNNEYTGRVGMGYGISLLKPDLVTRLHQWTGYCDRDARDPSQALSAGDANEFRTVAPRGALQAAWEISSVAAGQFTETFNAVDSSARKYMYLTISEEPDSGRVIDFAPFFFGMAG